MALHQISNKISNKLSIKYFGLRLPLSYVFFNKIFNRYLINKDIDDKNIKKFFEDGFVKLDLNIKDELKTIQINAPQNNINEKKQKLLIDYESQKKLKKIIVLKFDKIFNNLSKYFNSDIVIVNANLFRNHHVSVNEGNTDKEYYSNQYHNDGYVKTYFKIFINLMDVNEKDGPLHIISKKKSKEFIKEANYINRNTYIPINDEKLIYKNTGKYGDCFLFSSSECMHKAGVPETFRDMLALTLIASPKKISKKKDIDIYQKNEDLIYSAKPNGFVKVIDLLIQHFRFYKKNTSNYKII
tara:strand:+ start:6575 stop:7468 length:894 start_codon:yes stop_codon:yes gene_type:complete